MCTAKRKNCWYNSHWHKGLGSDCLLIQQPVLIASQSILYSFSYIAEWLNRYTLVVVTQVPLTLPAGLIALMDLLAVLSSVSDHWPQKTHTRWWQWYVAVNLSMWNPDSSHIIILSQASAHTETLPPCSADNQLIFMFPTGALWKVIMTTIMP